jgi:hypothetical protein
MYRPTQLFLLFRHAANSLTGALEDDGRNGRISRFAVKCCVLMQLKNSGGGYTDIFMKGKGEGIRHPMEALDGNA